jgi:hypothetical protein
MFSRGNQEKKTESPLVDELRIDEIDNSGQALSKEKEVEELEVEEVEEEQPVTVKLVEKISGILSPYFIVIVGLYLYDDNFLFGGVLILTGILSLLKISYQDIGRGINKLKNLLTQDNSLD